MFSCSRVTDEDFFVIESSEPDWLLWVTPLKTENLAPLSENLQEIKYQICKNWVFMSLGLQKPHLAIFPLGI